MKRIYPEYAYGPGPRDTCWWDETIAAPEWPTLQGDLDVDVAIVGGGCTGMSAALHLAESGVSVALLEAETPGWGASGRNGGFCCLGGAMLSAPAMEKSFGLAAANEFGQAEVAAVDLVSDLIESNLDYLLNKQNEKKITIALHPYLHAYFTKGIRSKRVKWLFKYGKWVRILC